MKGFFMQGVAVLFARNPEVSELEALLDNDYDIFHTAQESTWPMGGPGFVVDYRPEVNGKCVVHVSDRQWPDDMGDPKQSPEVFGAWSMGYFGPGAFPGSLGRAVMQCHAWPDAEDVVPRHRAFVRLLITYVGGAGKDAKVAPLDYEPIAEFSWLLKVARRLLDHPDALCFFNPNGEVLMNAEHIDTLSEQWAARNLPPLEAAASVRFWNIDETWMLGDIVGMSQFCQPDLQVAFQPQNLEVHDIAHFQVNVALFLLKSQTVMKNGDTVDGPGGKWRVQVRDKAVSAPPRSVLHWTLDGGPTPPPALRGADNNVDASVTAPAGGPPPLSPTPPEKLPSPEELRRRSIDWLRSPGFDNAYRFMHFPRWALSIMALIQFRNAKAIMRRGSRRGFRTAALHKRYQDLAEKGDALLVTMVMHNTSMFEDATERVPCLGLGSFDPTAFDTVLEVADRLRDLYGEDDLAPEDAELARIVNGDEHLGGRRVLLPKDQTDGTEIFAFDVLASKEDLAPGPTVGATFVILAERGPSGTAIVVPWKVATGAA